MSERTVAALAATDPLVEVAGPEDEREARELTAAFADWLASAALPGGEVRTCFRVGPPLEESLEGFWSPGMSAARLRALPPSPVAPPDLPLRLSDPPPVQVRGQWFHDLLATAYGHFAGTGPDTYRAGTVRPQIRLRIMCGYLSITV